MQPIYLAGHSRPVRQVKYNMDGDLLFTCSDDSTVCMYRSSDCARIGVFHIREACKGFDISADSKYVITASTNFGVQVFNTMNGAKLVEMKLPSDMPKQVKSTFFSLGDKMYLVAYELDKMSYVDVYDFQKTMSGKDTKEALITTITLPKDQSVTCAKWGPLNKTIYIATLSGRFMIVSVENGQVVIQKDVH